MWVMVNDYHSVEVTINNLLFTLRLAYGYKQVTAGYNVR
jgi:hypothetical protein